MINHVQVVLREYCTNREVCESAGLNWCPVTTISANGNVEETNVCSLDCNPITSANIEDVIESVQGFTRIAEQNGKNYKLTQYKDGKRVEINFNLNQDALEILNLFGRTTSSYNGNNLEYDFENHKFKVPSGNFIGIQDLAGRYKGILTIINYEGMNWEIVLTGTDVEVFNEKNPMLFVNEGKVISDYNGNKRTVNAEEALIIYQKDGRQIKSLYDLDDNKKTQDLRTQLNRDIKVRSSFSTDPFAKYNPGEDAVIASVKNALPQAGGLGGKAKLLIILSLSAFIVYKRRNTDVSDS